MTGFNLKMPGKFWHPKPKKKRTKMPKVSIVTITKDRRKFIPHLINSVAAQTWPKDDLEWVIVDDGEDKIQDLVQDIPYVNYRYVEGPLALGRKYNTANALARGEYIFYFDDDDYSFPARITIGVQHLDRFPQAMIVGSTGMYIYDSDLKKIYVCGPYHPNHATSGTWGFRRSLLSHTRYDDTITRTTEVNFTNNWAVPIQQVGRNNTIVATDHGGNNVSKKHLIKKAKKFYEPEEIIPDQASCDFLRTL